MKKMYLLVLLYIVFLDAVNAQDFTIDKFNQMTLNSISMNQLFPSGKGMNWSLISSNFGKPIKQYDTFVESNRKHFEYSGAELIYDDGLGGFYFLVAIVTSPNYVFTYDGLQIKVGNNISTLSAKFPLKYNKRSEGEMYISHIVADIWMAIYYDSNNVITKIKLEQNLL